MNQNEKVTLSCFCGILSWDSPLREFFKSGIVPLVDYLSVPAVLGVPPNVERANVFFVMLCACTQAQKVGMAALMVAMGQGSREEALRVVLLEDSVPIRAHNVDRVSFVPMSFTLRDTGADALFHFRMMN
jgi:hypothetical protein